MWNAPDFKEVIERRVATVSHGVFIFQILKKQHILVIYRLRKSFLAKPQSLFTWYFRLLCSGEPVSEGEGCVWGLEKLRVPNVISPSRSFSLLFHPSVPSSDPAVSSSPSNTKASSMVNCVAMATVVKASYASRSLKLVLTVVQGLSLVLPLQQYVTFFL